MGRSTLHSVGCRNEGDLCDSGDASEVQLRAHYCLRCPYNEGGVIGMSLEDLGRYDEGLQSRESTRTPVSGQVQSI